jgi:dihydroxy-acid dehydratase
VEPGDRIAIDIPARSITLLVPDEVLAERRRHWRPPPRRITSGYLARYAAMVTSADTGAILRVPEG